MSASALIACWIPPHDKDIMTRIDETQEHDRLLVATRHEIALRSNGRLASVLHDAACTLDGYRAGLTLATPHPLTGYRLVSTAVSDLDFAPTSSLCHDEEELAR